MRVLNFLRMQNYTYNMASIMNTHTNTHTHSHTHTPGPRLREILTTHSLQGRIFLILGFSVFSKALKNNN